MAQSNRVVLVTSAIALVVTACSDDPVIVPPGLVDVIAAAPAVCPSGGVTVRRGRDANGNGALDESEVFTTSHICDDPSQLVLVTDLGAGAAGCVFGASRIETGLDNGDGGGIADNGVLEPGEIDGSRTVCTGQGYFARSTDAPQGGDGTNILALHGGDASAGAGSNAGSFTLNTVSGSLGGHLKIYRNGTAPVTVSAPTLQSGFGPEPLNLVAATTIDLLADPTALPPGTPYRDAGGFLRIWTGTQARTPTGLRIGPGATVTFSGTDPVTLTFTHDVDIEGMLALTRSAGSGRALDITGRSVVVRSSGAIENWGIDAAAAAGGNGGAVLLTAAGPGSAMVAGAIRTFGGSGTTGGAAGNVTITASAADAYVTADIDAHGGVASGGAGGKGGDVALRAPGAGSLFVGGHIDATGGRGTTTGGLGGAVQLTTEGLLATVAVIDASGGSGATGVGGGNFTLHGRALQMAGTMTSHGGVGASVTGGKGGDLGLTLVSGTQFLASRFMPEDTTFSGSIDLAGGGGATGGGIGGSMAISADYQSAALGQEIVFYGVPRVDLHGGGGTTSGGVGGSFTIANNCAVASLGGSPGPSGGVFLTANLDVGGGNGGSAAGGASGMVDVSVCNSGVNTINPEARVSSSGGIDASGGDGATGGNGGTAVRFVGINGVDVRGNLDAGAGNGSAGTGGNVTSLRFVSDNGSISIAGNLAMDGGSGTTTGGNAPSTPVQIYGDSVTLSGEWSAHGGGASQPAGTGGNGGNFAIWSVDRATHLDAALTILVTSGGGTTPGRDGYVIVDGSDLTAALQD